MRVLILGGFLGSGKTTVLLQAAQRAVALSNGLASTSVAILENEIGDVSVDDITLSKDGYNVTNLLAGCACCTLAGELPFAVAKIQEDLDCNLLFIETTGVAIPGLMRENLQSGLGLEVEICVVVDAKRWRRMLMPLNRLLSQQIEVADRIIINKSNLISKDELAFVIESVREFNPSAEVKEIDASCQISTDTLDWIIGGGM